MKMIVITNNDSKKLSDSDNDIEKGQGSLCLFLSLFSFCFVCSFKNFQEVLCINQMSE